MCPKRLRAQVLKMMTHPAGKGARGAQHIVLDMKSYRNRNRILSIIGAGDGGGYGGGGRRFLEGCGEGRGGKEEHFCLRTFGGATEDGFGDKRVVGGARGMGGWG